METVAIGVFLMSTNMGRGFSGGSTFDISLLARDSFGREEYRRPYMRMDPFDRPTEFPQSTR